MASYVGWFIHTFAILLPLLIACSEGRMLKEIGKEEIDGHENQALGGGGGGGYEEDFRPIDYAGSSPGVRHSTTPIDYAGEEQPYEGRVLKAIGKEEIDGHENQAMVVDSHQNTEEGDDHGYDLPPPPHDHSVTGKKDRDKDSPPTMTVDRRRLAIDDTVTEGGGGYEEDFRPTAPSSSPGVRHSNTTIDYAGEQQP